LLAIKSYPILAPKVNPNKMIDALLSNGNFDDNEIAEFLEADAYSSRDIVAAAQEACEEIIEKGKATIETNYEANVFFLFKINSFIRKFQSSKLEPQKLAVLNEYFNRHTMVVVRNMQQDQAVKSLIQMQGQSMSQGMPSVEQQPSEQQRLSLEPASPQGTPSNSSIPGASLFQGRGGINNSTLAYAGGSG